jgi:hypothetical protein
MLIPIEWQQLKAGRPDDGLGLTEEPDPEHWLALCLSILRQSNERGGNALPLVDFAVDREALDAQLHCPLGVAAQASNVRQPAHRPR